MTKVCFWVHAKQVTICIILFDFTWRKKNLLFWSIVGGVFHITTGFDRSRTEYGCEIHEK